MQKWILYLLFIILLSSCATFQQLDEKIYNTYAEIDNKYITNLTDYDFNGKNKIIFQIQTYKIPESFINTFHNTFTDYFNFNFDRNRFIAQNDSVLTVDYNKNTIDDYIKKYQNKELKYLILITPIKAYHYVKVTYSYAGAGFGMTGFRAPVSYKTYDNGITLKINCKIIDLKSRETLIDFNSFSSTGNESSDLAITGDKIAKNIVDVLSFLNYDPEIRTMIQKFINTGKLDIINFLTFCRLKNIKVKETRLDYIIDNDIYIPKNNDNYTYISNHWEIEELFPKIKFSQENTNKKKENKTPEKDIIFDITL